MLVLTERQKKLAEQLLITVIKKEPTVTYSELAGRIVPPMHHRNVGKDIGEISKLCHQMGLPLISAKVVNKNSQSVGNGFFADDGSKEFYACHYNELVYAKNFGMFFNAEVHFPL